MTEESENRKVLTSCPAHARAIGEVARSDGGVQKYPQQRERIRASSSPLPCPVALRGVPIKGYRRVPAGQED